MATISISKSLEEFLTKYPQFTAVAYADSQNQSGDQTQPAFDFDSISKLDSSYPALIALTDFVSCYDNEGNLNSNGKFFQFKQDSDLIVCADAVKQLLDYADSNEEFKKYLESNRKELFKFCNEFTKDIAKLLANFEKVKTRLNTKFDISTDEQFYLTQNNIIPSGINLFKMSEILKTSENIEAYTSTKVWLQACIELKEILTSGLGEGLFSVSAVPGNFPKRNYPESIVLNLPRHYEKNKIKLSDNQTFLTDYFNNAYSITSNYQQLKNTLTSVFSTNDSSIFNNRSLANFYSDPDKSKSIGALSYLISKEFVASKTIKKIYSIPNNASLSPQGYNFPAEYIDISPSSTILWNYVVGDVIFDNNNEGSALNFYINGSLSELSLMKLSQIIDAKNNKVLTFEKNKIISSKDNSSLAVDEILIPGAEYYIDNSLSLVNKGFDTKNITTLTDKLQQTYSALKEIDGLLIADSSSPRSLDDQVVSGYSAENMNVKDLASQIENALSNPISLIRLIEQHVLIPSGLIERFKMRPLLTNGGPDLSSVLISLGLQDPAILSHIFMFVMGNANSMIASETNTTYVDASYITTIANNIQDAISSHFYKSPGIEKSSKSASFFLASIFDIKAGPIAAAVSSFTLLNISKLLASIGLYFNKIQNNSDSPFLKASPNRTVYSGLSKTAIMTMVFYICCLIIDASNPERIVSLQTEKMLGQNIQKIRVENTKVSENELIIDSKKINSYFAVDSPYFIYQIDEILVSCENQIQNEILGVRGAFYRLLSYISLLKKDLNNFVSELAAGGNFYQDIFQTINTLVPNEIIAKTLMTPEQLILLQSRLLALKTRLSETYSSNLNSIVPYFYTLKDKKVDSFLPLEDAKLISWNYFLNDYLKSKNYRQPSADNKKILSVGIPQKLLSKLKKPLSVDELLKSNTKSERIAINVYLTDHLRPSLVYKPKSYLFDTKLYPTKVLNFFVDPDLTSSSLKNSTRLFLPFFDFSAFSNLGNIKPKDIVEEIGKTTASDEMIENHIASLMLGMYLEFSTGKAFDENCYFQYSALGNYTSADVTSPVKQDNLLDYLKTNTLLSDISTIKRELITPKKFDRVFHLLVDPNDFEIDVDSTGTSVVKDYESSGYIKNVSNQINGQGSAVYKVSDNVSDFMISSFAVELESR